VQRNIAEVVSSPIPLARKQRWGRSSVTLWRTSCDPIGCERPCLFVHSAPELVTATRERAR
jgi:hypothetical protein